MSNKFFKSMDSSNGFESNFDLLMKGIDRSKNHLKTITDKSGHTRKVWVANEGTETTDAGRNAGKQYEKTGKRHTEHSGFSSGDEVSFIAGGKIITGVFRHVNENKHGAMAVIRGGDGKLYERAVSKISKPKGGDPETRNKIRDMLKKETPKSTPETKKQFSIHHGNGAEFHKKLVAAGYSESDAEDYMDEYKQGGSKIPQKAHDILSGKKPTKIADMPITSTKDGKTTISEKEATAAPRKKPTPADDKLKKVAEIKAKADLSHDLTKLKQAFKEVAGKDEYNPVLDDANHGDASALKVLVRQWKHKAAQKGVDIASLGLKYKEVEPKTGKNTSEVPEQ